MKKYITKLIFYIIIGIVFFVSWQSQSVVASELETASGELITSDAGMVIRVAPGEFLPISVKLINFGGRERVDVTIDYQVLDKNNNVLITQNETVAVETSASFVKNIQIPHSMAPGEYYALSKIVYRGQEVPATSRFSFSVEKKIAGIFVSMFILYVAIIIVVGIFFVVVSRLILKRRVSRNNPHEYGNVPQKDRIFYEIISDQIRQMRFHEGDKALEVVNGIEGLKIDENGKVLEINKDPAEIVALLMLQYEKYFGNKVQLDSLKKSGEAKDKMESINQNIEMIKKYFK